MAIQPYTILNPSATLSAEEAARVQRAYSNILVVQWPDLMAGDEGAPFDLPDFADRSVQVSGVPGGAATSIKGTIDEVEWPTLSDPLGNALNITSTPKIQQLLEITRKIKPVVTGGDVTTNLTVTVIFRRNNP